jgi:signal transducer and activator of transcription 5B
MLWDQTQKLPKDTFKQVESMYMEQGFPMDVRLHLAAFVESKFLTNNEVDESTAINVASELLSQLDKKIGATPNDPDKYLMKNKLQELSDSLKEKYFNNLVGLYLTVKNCLESERQIVSQFSGSQINMSSGSGSGFGSPVGGDIGAQIRQTIEKLKNNVTETNGELDRCKQDQEAFSVEYYSFREQNQRYEAMLQQSGPQKPEVVQMKKQKDSATKTIQERFHNLNTRRTALLNAYVQIHEEYKQLQTLVLEKELLTWQREQQMAGNGYNMNDSRSIEVIQEWCEGLADIIWSLKQQVKQLQTLRDKIQDPQNPDAKPNLLMEITTLLYNLVKSTFIIEKQPPQVMKTNTRFTSTVRLLVGGTLNIHMAAPAVTVSIVNENQAYQLLASSSNTQIRKEDFNSGDILNGTGTMEYHNTTRQVSVSFRNLQLKKIKRTEKKGTESVMDEKFSVLFWTEFHVGELEFQLWARSLPVVVIVHGNQEPQALATVTWDNAFAEWGRRPFNVPDKVTWGQVASALDMKWAHACGSKLTEENLYYLACKAFRNNNLPMNTEEINKLVLSWPLFCKEALPDRNFTFWEWFYRLLILTQTHMQKLWSEGHVMGFITKQAAENALMDKPSGTFLLRFSDSELGGVTIAYVRKPDPFAPANVFMVAPFTTRNLSQRSMADVIFDIGDLTQLYPNTNKEVFKKFCTSSTTSANLPSNGYVRHTLVTQVEGVSTGMDSNPATPHNPYGDGSSTPGYPTSEASFQNPPYMDNMETDMDFTNIDVHQLLGIPLGADDNFVMPSLPN